MKLLELPSGEELTIGHLLVRLEPKEAPRLDQAIELAERMIRGRYPSPSALTQDPIVQAYRKFFWRLGIDPTKRRVSSEALVRRWLRKGFPRISPLIDAYNLASALSLVPISGFDADKLAPPLTLRRASPGEEFSATDGSPVRLSGGELLLVDREGRVLAMIMHRDSSVAALSDDSRRALFICYGCPGVPEARIREALSLLRQYLALVASLSVEAEGLTRCGMPR